MKTKQQNRYFALGVSALLLVWESVGCFAKGAKQPAATHGAATTAGAEKDSDLFLAAFDGDLAKVNALLAAGADPNAKTTDNGATALMMASLEGHTEVVNALLAAKADPNAKRTGHGATALYWASYTRITATPRW